MENQIDIIHTVIEKLYPQVIHYCCFCWPRFGEQIAHEAIIKLIKKNDIGEFEYRGEKETFNYIKSKAFQTACNTYRLKDEKCVSWDEICETGIAPDAAEIAAKKKTKKKKTEQELPPLPTLPMWVRMHTTLIVLMRMITSTYIYMLACMATPDRVPQLQQIYLFPAVDIDRPRAAQAKQTKRQSNINVQQQIMLFA